MRHKSPKTGAVEEKHLKTPPMVKMDKLPHLYTLILKPDNTYGSANWTPAGMRQLSVRERAGD